eukprot:14480013-Alexandrium_andersonii.AAC.1
MDTIKGTQGQHPELNKRSDMEPQRAAKMHDAATTKSDAPSCKTGNTRATAREPRAKEETARDRSERETRLE